MEEDRKLRSKPVHLWLIKMSKNKLKIPRNKPKISWNICFKEGKTKQCWKDSLLKKCCWESWTATYKTIKLDHSLKPNNKKKKKLKMD